MSEFGNDTGSARRFERSEGGVPAACRTTVTFDYGHELVPEETA
jgi:hypothetical protein